MRALILAALAAAFSGCSMLQSYLSEEPRLPTKKVEPKANGGYYEYPQ